MKTAALLTVTLLAGIAIGQAANETRSALTTTKQIAEAMPEAIGDLASTLDATFSDRQITINAKPRVVRNGTAYFTLGSEKVGSTTWNISAFAATDQAEPPYVGTINRVAINASATGGFDLKLWVDIKSPD